MVDSLDVAAIPVEVAVEAKPIQWTTDLKTSSSAFIAAKQAHEDAQEEYELAMQALDAARTKRDQCIADKEQAEADFLSSVGKIP